MSPVFGYSWQPGIWPILKAWIDESVDLFCDSLLWIHSLSTLTVSNPTQIVLNNRKDILFDLYTSWFDLSRDIQFDNWIRLELTALLITQHQTRKSFSHFFCGSGSGCPATNFCKVSDFSEPIEPCWESNRTCKPDPGRGVKHQSLEWERGCRGSGSNARSPVRELARWTTRPHRWPKFLACYEMI
jgi:hypothetical protein